MAAATQCALRGVQQLHWPARSLDLSTIENAWDLNLLFLLSLSQILPNCDRGCKLLGKHLSQDDIRHLYDRLHSRIYAWAFAKRTLPLPFTRKCSDVFPIFSVIFHIHSYIIIQFRPRSPSWSHFRRSSFPRQMRNFTLFHSNLVNIQCRLVVLVSNSL